jgi:hypothetical protein
MRTLKLLGSRQLIEANKGGPKVRYRPETECPLCSAVYKIDDFVDCPGKDCPGRDEE